MTHLGMQVVPQLREDLRRRLVLRLWGQYEHVQVL